MKQTIKTEYDFGSPLPYELTFQGLGCVFACSTAKQAFNRLADELKNMTEEQAKKLFGVE